MQSSAAVAGRALIMLACVVGIPALALSGSSWSAMLKKLQDFQWPAVLNFASASTAPTSNAMRPLNEPRMTGAPGDNRRAGGHSGPNATFPGHRAGTGRRFRGFRYRSC